MNGCGQLSWTRFRNVAAVRVQLAFFLFVYRKLYEINCLI